MDVQRTENRRNGYDNNFPAGQAEGLQSGPFFSSGCACRGSTFQMNTLSEDRYGREIDIASALIRGLQLLGREDIMRITPLPENPTPEDVENTMADFALGVARVNAERGAK
jgi:hypothetical protein